MRMHRKTPSAQRAPRPSLLALLVAACALAAHAPSALAQKSRSELPAASPQHATAAYWRDAGATLASQRGSTRSGQPAVQATRYRGLTLDRASMAGALAGAPMEGTDNARFAPMVLALPDPSGGFQRFAIVESPVMEPALAARHPQIKTYSGRGLDDTSASLRLSLTQLGFQASVRSLRGSWYIDPAFHMDQSLYASFWRRDAAKTQPGFAEPMLLEPQLSLERGRFKAGDTVIVSGAGFAPNGSVTLTVRYQNDAVPRQTIYAVASADGTLKASFVADPYRDLGSYEVTATDSRAAVATRYQVISNEASPFAATGNLLRTYRLALLSDPAYATYFGGSANVTAAKVALINRVAQIYRDETSINLVLIGNNDLLNLDTAAQFSQANGPCGGTACFPTATVSCSSTVLNRNREVLGLLVGASAFDVGHIGVGAGGGGIAQLGSVGGDGKARGCTGLTTPVGDLFAVDYVAHEIGHQFAGNHTFNGIAGSCTGGNRNAGTSVEPGSGSSIMAYAGICTTSDDLQPHSDPYWSQRSFDEIVTFVNTAESAINEVQLAVLRNFNTNGQQFLMRFGGNDSAAIVRGTNFTAAGIKAAIEGITGWPAGGTVTVSTPTDTAFTITFGGTLTGTNVANLELVSCTLSCTGFVGEVAKGGTTTRGGVATATTNTAPLVTVAGATFTIPLRTPFALTGSATDANGDTITYMWEQTDRGAAAGTSLISNTKADGPLFRQFGTRAVVSNTDTLLYNSPGENAVTTNPTRVFPDLDQILINNTNAETGACPAASSPPTAAQIDCFSEFLPTAGYVGFAGVNASPLSLNFKLTARDGRGGVNSATTQLLLATGAGPFLVTSQNTAGLTFTSGSPVVVTWNVANTNAAPVSTANVKISLSTDGGLTYPTVLAASAPNNGSAQVTLPAVQTSTARLKVEAVGNVYFDINNANFSIRVAGDVDGNGVVNCADLAIVRAAFGTSTGQPGFNAAADLNGDGIVNIRDLAFVTQRIPAGTVCP